MANIFNVGFEVLKAVVLKSSIFWDITPCSPLKANRRLGGTYRIHLHSRRIRQERGQHDEGSNKTSSSETSVEFQRSIRRYIQEDMTQHF
jgi:hypothetical protein